MSGNCNESSNVNKRQSSTSAEDTNPAGQPTDTVTYDMGRMTFVVNSVHPENATKTLHGILYNLMKNDTNIY